MGESYAHPEVLVSADWVEGNLKEPKVRIVESDEDVLLYNQSHIPGAVKIDWQGDLQDQLTRDYINADKFAAICSRSGCDPETIITGSVGCRCLSHVASSKPFIPGIS